MPPRATSSGRCSGARRRDGVEFMPRACGMGRWRMNNSCEAKRGVLIGILLKRTQVVGRNGVGEPGVLVALVKADAAVGCPRRIDD